MSKHAQNHSDQDQLLNRVGDLSQRVRELEGEIERLHRLATLGTIAGSIAHEFNNILTPVMSYAQLALQAKHDAVLVEKALQKTVEGTDRAARIASAMLGFVRDGTAESNSFVERAIADSIACIGRDPAKDGIELIVQCEPSLVADIQAVALQQVLLNLLLNALDAVRPGSGRITVSAKRTTGNGARNQIHSADVITITVEDNGCGIPAAQLDSIFEPFVTSRRQRERGEGTGLGLAICRRLINQAGGSITVTSTEGRGATFTIVLPAAAPVTAQKAA